MASVTKFLGNLIPSSYTGRAVVAISGASLASPVHLAKAFGWIIRVSKITVLGEEVSFESKSAFAGRIVNRVTELATPIRLVAGLVLLGTLYICRQSSQDPDSSKKAKSA